MSQNDVVVLNSILDKQKKKTGGSLKDDEFFEVFAYEQILKNFDLAYEEMLDGNIDGGDDGGIDGFFTMVDGDILKEDTDLAELRRSPNIDVFLIQVKQETTFGEYAVLRVINTTRDIFDLTKDINVLANLYNNKLISKIKIFKEAFLGIATLYPNLRVHYVYASKGNTSDVHPKIKELGETFCAEVKQFFSGAIVTVDFLGARELLEISRIEKIYTLQLKFQENPLSKGDDNYVLLSNLNDYYSFVTDEYKKLRKYMFDSNVRDYQGNVEVNRDILATLDTTDQLDFWWLNNGITILASKASIAGKSITLDNVQIVNGLQTTTAIYNYLFQKQQLDEKDSKRSVLIRIIVTDDPAARDRIIKATNFQTAIPAASLRATDKIQRDIEDYFESHGLYYDRRKNYYKNIGKPIDKILGIPYLAQSIMAIVLREPDNARARPSSLIKNPTDYARVFNETTGMDIYLKCAQVMRIVDSYVRAWLSVEPNFTETVTNLKFHFAMVLIARLTGKTDYTNEDIRKIDLNRVTDDLLEKCFTFTNDKAVFFGDFKSWSIERLSKNREFVDEIIQKLSIWSESRDQAAESPSIGPGGM